MLEQFKSDLQVWEEYSKFIHNYHFRKAWWNAGFSSEREQELSAKNTPHPHPYLTLKSVFNTFPAYLAYYILKHKLNAYEARAYVKQNIRSAKKKYPTKALKNWIRSEVDRYLQLYSEQPYPQLYKLFK